MIKIDEIDSQILDILQHNGKTTIKEMANQLGMSTTPIFERLKKLENSGIIDHYAAVLNTEKLNKKLYAFAHISLKDHSKGHVEEFTKQIVKIPEVLECHYVTGDSDFILKILLGNMEEYRDFMMNQLFDMSNIAKIESFLSLDVLKKSNRIPLFNLEEK